MISNFILVDRILTSIFYSYVITNYKPNISELNAMFQKLMVPGVSRVAVRHGDEVLSSRGPTTVAPSEVGHRLRSCVSSETGRGRGPRNAASTVGFGAAANSE